MRIDLNRAPLGVRSTQETHSSPLSEGTTPQDILLAADSPEKLIENLNRILTPYHGGAVRFRLVSSASDGVYTFVRTSSRLPPHYSVLSQSGDLLARIEWERREASGPSVSDQEIRSALDGLRSILVLKFENWSLKSRLDSQLASSIRALSRTIEAKDSYTGGHTQRVYRYSDRLISRMDLPETQAEKIRLAGLLHDIGKIGVPDRILLKPASLDEAEWEIMRSHTQMGYSIVSEIAGLEEVAEILKHHHERWDGKGYALGLKELEIPFESRVIAVADAFDAITTHRPYREASSVEEARSIITSLSGTHFDPYVVRQFQAVFEGLVEDVNAALR